jgi:hypothetical protein
MAVALAGAVVATLFVAKGKPAVRPDPEYEPDRAAAEAAAA